MDFTAHITSPLLFRKWAAISILAGALERKVWVRTKGSPLYPNLYIILCAPPGIGKTEVTWRVRDMWIGLEEHHVANSSVTKAALIDNLNEAARKVLTNNEADPMLQFNSLLVASNELGVLIPSYDNEFMNTLTDLYDGKPYAESRRTKDLRIKIERPNLNIIAACTPAYLRETLPPGAWDQGFLSRVLLIYSGEQQPTSLFAESDEDEEMLNGLRYQLGLISEMHGQFKFTEEARDFIDAWHLGGGEPRPEHPRLAHYNTRRTAHLLKLSMVAAVSRMPKSLLIEVHDIQLALDWMVEAEFYMNDIFKSMAIGGDSQVIEETWHHLFSLYMKEGKKPIGEHRMVHFLQDRTPAHNIVRILEIMTKSKMIKRAHVKGLGMAYEPDKKPRE